MEDCCSSSLLRAGIGQLIGGIAIEPTAVLGKDPTIISGGRSAGTRESPEAGVMNIGVGTPRAKCAALPSQPAVQETTGIADNNVMIVQETAGITDNNVATVVIGKKPRGRPKKYPPGDGKDSDVPKGNPEVPKGDSEVPVVKRGRGRPRKTTAVVTGSPVTPGTPVIKRGRGRPKKTDVVTSASPGIKKGRGRPHKMVATTNGSAAPVVIAVKPSLSITDPEYQSSSIDKTIEKMIKTTAESPNIVVKRPVGRPRKRPLGVPDVVEVKQPKEMDMDIGLSKSISGTLKISKEMVNKMMEKGKDQQPTQQGDSFPQDTEEPQVQEVQGQEQEEVQGQEEGQEQEEVPAPMDAPIVKRRPGRPRKVFPPGEGSKRVSIQKTDMREEGTPVKRKRGRPRKYYPGLPPSPSKSNEIDARSDASITDSPTKPAAKRPRGRPPKKAAGHKSEEDPEVMGKLQVSFSESESECSDPLHVQRSTIDALTDRVAPPIPPQQPPNDSLLLLDNKFEESFDEDSDN